MLATVFLRSFRAVVSCNFWTMQRAPHALPSTASRLKMFWNAVTFFPVNTIMAHYRWQNLDTVLESGNFGEQNNTPPSSSLLFKVGLFVGCLLFSTGSLNSSTTLDRGVGEWKALFSLFKLANIMSITIRRWQNVSSSVVMKCFFFQKLPVEFLETHFCQSFWQSSPKGCPQDAPNY